MIVIKCCCDGKGDYPWVMRVKPAGGFRRTDGRLVSKESRGYKVYIL